MTKESACSDPTIEPQAEAEQPASADVQEPSSAIGPSMEPRWPACKQCGSTAPPLKSGQCATDRCRVFRAGFPRKKSVEPDKDREAILEASFVTRYNPQDEIDRSLCREAARTLARYEVERDPNRRKTRLAEYEALEQKLEAIRDARRAAAAGASGKGGNVVIYIPDNKRESENVCDENILREIRGEAQPGAPEPSRDAAVGSDAPAAAVAPPVPQPEYLVPERVVSENGRKSEIRMRAVTEDDVLRCMDLQGDAENYRRGLIPRFIAFRQTANWIKAQFN